MRRVLAILSSRAVVIAPLAATGCSSSPSSPASSGGCDLTMPVSFKNDVIPVFQTACTFTAACHGQMNNVREENLYLGEHLGTPDASMLHGLLVGVASKEAPSMDLVTAGDLDRSFLWQKVAVIGVPGKALSTSLAGACAMATPQCSNCSSTMPCGDTMPDLSGPLLATDSCTLESWISQGAKNN
jgi:hypothetical protein